MKLQPLTAILTLTNLILVVILLAQMHPANAQPQQQAIAPVIRCRSFELVDSLGKVRASLKIEPEVVYQGKKYSQTVILRLIDSKGGPNVKLSTSEDGAGFNLSNTLQGGVQIIARDTSSFIRIKDKGGKEMITTPIRHAFAVLHMQGLACYPAFYICTVIRCFIKTVNTEKEFKCYCIVVKYAGNAVAMYRFNKPPG